MQQRSKEGHTVGLLRASAKRGDRRWCLRAPRSYCWQAGGTRIFRPSACGGLATSLALFMRGGEGNPHELLLANLLQSSKSAFSCVSFPKLFCLPRKHVGCTNFGTFEFVNSIRALNETLRQCCQQRLKAPPDVSDCRLNKHRLIGFDHRVGHCKVLHMLVACMGGNAYTRIDNPADVETIQSRYTYLTPGAGELTDGPQRPYGQRVQGVS
jgi:hypothetical protein